MNEMPPLFCVKTNLPSRWTSKKKSIVKNDSQLMHKLKPFYTVNVTKLTVIGLTLICYLPLAVFLTGAMICF